MTQAAVTRPTHEICQKQASRRQREVTGQRQKRGEHIWDGGMEIDTASKIDREGEEDRGETMFGVMQAKAKSEASMSIWKNKTTSDYRKQPLLPAPA